MVKEIKEIHPENIVMIKCGNFYKVYGKDAYIISNLFKYSIKEEQDIISSGFPVNSIKKIEAKLESKKINYMVIDKRDNYNVNDRVEFKNLNTYQTEYENSTFFLFLVFLQTSLKASNMFFIS